MISFLLAQCQRLVLEGKKIQREQFNVCVILPGEWMEAVREEVPGRFLVRYALEWPLEGPWPIPSYFWKVGKWFSRKVRGFRPSRKLEWEWQRSCCTPKTSLTTTSFLPPVTCLVLVVQVQYFLEPVDLELFVAGNYLDGRDVAMFAFHSKVLPAHERRTWYCGEKPRQECGLGRVTSPPGHGFSIYKTR